MTPIETIITSSQKIPPPQMITPPKRLPNTQTNNFTTNHRRGIAKAKRKRNSKEPATNLII